mmetsp:Transcript_24100/g.29929  ORF Transcript_24100/g.29929 Transcript_24100/m.29929 type:complete len:133 (+) Transcript_24100:552-950(+)
MTMILWMAATVYIVGTIALILTLIVRIAYVPSQRWTGADIRGQGAGLYRGLTTEECAKLGGGSSARSNNRGQVLLTDDECAICCASLKEAQLFVMPGLCQHRFHKECIFKWLKKEARCPLCRTDLRSVLNDG